MTTASSYAAPATAVPLLLGLVLVLPSPVRAQQLDHFTCYKVSTAKGAPRFATVAGVTVVDRFRTSTVEVKKPERLCAPTDKLGEDPSAPQHDDHLEGYKIKPSTRFAGAANQRIVDQFNADLRLDLKKPSGLLVPTHKSLTGPANVPTNYGVAHFQCYTVRPTRGAPRFVPVPDVTIEDQFGAMTIVVKKPRRLCAPANKNGEEPGAEDRSGHLMCYLVKQTSTPRFATVRNAHLHTQFGPETLDVKKPVELCVPALRNPPDTPDPTPTVTPAETATPTVTATPTPTVTATPIPFHRLSVTRVGSGVVTSSPPGIDCGGDCIEDYEHLTVVDLAATPASGFTFLGWGDACSGAGACQVTTDAAKNVDATFEPETPACTNEDPTLILSPAPVPGPAVLYTAPPVVPQLESRHPRFRAAPLLVAGREAYVDGEYLYQDYVDDDWGAETSGGPFNTTFVTSPLTGTATQDAANPNTGDVTYPTDVARYGNNAADLAELRIAPGPDDVAYRITLNTLLANDTTMVAIAWNADNNLNTGAAPLTRNPGANVRGTDELLFFWGEGTGPAAAARGEHVRYTGNGTTATSTVVTPLADVAIDLETNQITALVPRSLHDPSGTLWRYVALTGLHDGTGTWLRPGGQATATTPGGAGTADNAPVAIFDLNNHSAIAQGQSGTTGELCHFLDAPCDMVQAVDLRRANGVGTPELSKYARAVDFNQLAAGTSSTNVPGGAHGLPGPAVPATGIALVRIFPSRLVTTPAEGRSRGLPGVPRNDSIFFHGALQAYSVFVPGGTPAGTPLPVTWANHSLAQFHWQYNGTRYVREIGQQRGSLVVTPNSRATDGFYVGRNEFDHFEVWNDVLRHYDVDMSRVAMSGYSMGGYATYRLATLYPDLFGKAFGIVGPPAAGIWQGTGGASISEDQGDDYSTLTNYWLENVRNIPFFNMAMETDELVPVSGTRQQNIGGVDQTGEAQSLDGLGYRYTYQEFTTGEHVTLFLNDQYPVAKDFLGTAEIDPDPVHVTFTYVPESDRADLTLVHDHAYWVSRLTLRNAVGTPTTSGSKSAKGTIDAYSFGFGLADPAVSAQTTAPGTLTGGNVGPLAYTQYQRTWAAPQPITAENTLSVTLTNLRAVQIDVARAALDSAAELRIETVADGDTTLDLFGAFPSATEIYEDDVRLCATDGAMVGPLGARVPVRSGARVYSLRAP